MGKGKTPSYTPPPPPKLPSADELFASGTNYAKKNAPLAFGAREGALSDLSRGSEYYAGFQPTSFEDALSSQYFQNVWPDMQETIKHGLSMSGLDSSPLLARELGRARGELGVSIGSYLSDLGNQRAINSLNYRNIDPMSMISPFVEAGMNQGNNQAQLDYGYQQALAQQSYQNALAKKQSRGGMSQLIGTGLGALLALPTGGMSLAAGASLGSLAGQMASPFFGGSAPTAGGISNSLMNFGSQGGFGSSVKPVNSITSFGGGAINKPRFNTVFNPYEPLSFGRVLGMGGRG